MYILYSTWFGLGRLGSHLPMPAAPDGSFVSPASAPAGVRRSFFSSCVASVACGCSSIDAGDARVSVLLLLLCERVGDHRIPRFGLLGRAAGVAGSGGLSFRSLDLVPAAADLLSPSVSRCCDGRCSFNEIDASWRGLGAGSCGISKAWSPASMRKGDFSRFWRLPSAAASENIDRKPLRVGVAFCNFQFLQGFSIKGASCTKEEVEEITSATHERNRKLHREWREMVDNNRTHFPAIPLPVLPKITSFCVSEVECYHQRYRTEITSETAPNHPDFNPCEMMQVFSLRLSSPLSHSVNIYGTFAVRDCWEPLRNYLFKRSRCDPATIPQGCSFLPLSSPCRGVYAVQYFLIDINLWIKEERDGSADKLLFCGYVEMDTFLAEFGSKLRGRFQGDCHGVDLHFAYLPYGIETVIEVLAEAGHPSDVKFSALTSGFDDEISLYDDTFSGSGAMFKHCLAVNKKDELHIVLEMDGSQYKWTFKAGVGVVAAPEHPVPDFSQYFVMNVSFRARGKAASAWQWSCICNVLSTKPYL